MKCLKCNNDMSIWNNEPYWRCSKCSINFDNSQLSKNVEKYSISEIISYIQNSEIEIPVCMFFDEFGLPVTKKQYGKILLKILCNNISEHFVQ
jgi:hypothetical protein